MDDTNVKFTKDGTISITTEGKKKKKTDKGEVIIKIKDTSIDMPSNILPNWP